MRTFAIGISTVLCLVGGVVASRQITHHKADAKTSTAPVSSISSRPQSDKGAIIHQFAKTPMAFEINHGQANSDAKFLARGAGYEIFLTPRESVFVLQAPAALQPKADQQHPFPASSRASVLHMELVGANSARMSAEEQLPGTSNYLIGKNSKNWHTDIPNYRRVREQAAYPGIDLVYYGTQKQLEYDFVVAPKTDASAIRFAMKGAEKLRTDAAGDLVVSVAGGELSFHKPFAYQQNGAEKVEVAANYALGADNTVSFKLGNYDHSRELVIDPILSYSTYLGGSNIDTANGIALASDGTAFIAGGTFSTDFPTAGSHPLQPNHGGPDDTSKDAFVAKLSADGTTVLYATYLGGTEQDEANGIAVDTFGQAYVTGTTVSPDFPVTFNSLNPDCGGDAKCGASFNNGGLVVSNAFVSKLNTAGSKLLYSTFLGEYEHVQGKAITVDNNQVAYVTGNTENNFFPTVTTGLASTSVAISKYFAPGIAEIITAGPSGVVPNQTVEIVGQTMPGTAVMGQTTPPLPLPTLFNGNFIVLQIVDASSFLVQNGAIDPTTPNGNGGTLFIGPPPFPISPNAAQGFYGGGPTNAFVTAISPTGSTVAYSTYLGGSGEDSGNGIAVDAAGNAYVTGLAFSTDFPVTASAAQGVAGGAGDAFFAKLNTQAAPGAGLAGLLYSSYIGGAGLDEGTGVALDANNNAYVGGASNSANLGTVGAYQPNCASPSGNTCAGDAFVAKFNSTATGAASLVYFTYVGGSAADKANAIAVDAAGNAYITGSTVSGDFPTSADAFQPNYGGGNADSFVSKIDPTGATLVYSSFLGGTNTDVAYGIAVDNATPPGIYVAGQTCSQDFPLSNPAQASSGGNCDAFVSKVGLLQGIAIAPTGLVFGPQTLNTTSVAQTITVTSGVAQVTLSAPTITGDFAISQTTCGASLSANSQCTISVVFTPSGDGTRTGMLSLSATAPGQRPQNIVASLSGTTSTTPDFSVVETGATSGTVSAGQAATFGLQVAAVNGYSQPVSFACSGLPSGATCNFSPNPVTPTSQATAVTLTISTAVRTLVPPAFRVNNNRPLNPKYPLVIVTMLATLLLIAVARKKQFIPRPALAGFALAGLLVLIAAGCGGGNATNTPAGTQAGTYTVTVVATSGSITHDTTLTLTVK